MPRILPLFLFATVILSLGVSQVVGLESVPFPRDPAYIHDPNQVLIDQLTQTDIPFEFRPAFPDRLEIWVSDKEFQELAGQGLTIEWVPEEDQVYWETPKGVAEEFVTPATTYPTFEQLTAFLQKKSSDYSDLCRLESIGQSVQGRDLWFLRISDNPDLEEDE
ncbi:MAG: hypothetical protein KC994_09925, partial [Candidatus Omnitrophica bacterium]|nr:hypothetical protein [Candidatus Omnitrophota bacterium]